MGCSLAVHRKRLVAQLCAPYLVGRRLPLGSRKDHTGVCRFQFVPLHLESSGFLGAGLID